MNSWPLIGAALAMGLTGSLHCIAMCSALQRTATGRAVEAPVPWSRSFGADTLWFHSGRIAGYAALGAAAGLSGHWLLQAAAWQPVFQSVWAALNAILLMLGLSLILLGRQPIWLDRIGAQIWHRVRPTTRPLVFVRDPANQSARPQRTSIGLALRGAAWALLPCGLLYSALALAVLASDALQASFVMAAFAIGTTFGLGAFQSLFTRLPSLARKWGISSPATADRLAFRINGSLLSAMALVALVAAIGGHANPFCAT